MDSQLALLSSNGTLDLLLRILTPQSRGNKVHARSPPRATPIMIQPIPLLGPRMMLTTPFFPLFLCVASFHMLPSAFFHSRIFPLTPIPLMTSRPGDNDVSVCVGCTKCTPPPRSLHRLLFRDAAPPFQLSTNFEANWMGFVKFNLLALTLLAFNIINARLPHFPWSVFFLEAPWVLSPGMEQQNHSARR